MYLAEVTAVTMESFLTSIGSFFTQSITWLGELVTFIVATPALAVVIFGMGITGFVFGLFRRTT